MKLTFAKLKDHKEDIIWITLLFLLIMIILYIYAYKVPLDFDNFCDAGDFGRDLYYFYLASTGKLPYVDFNWIYGPLVPFAYGLVFKLFGVSAFVALSFWYFIFVISVILIFCIVRTFSTPFFGFLAALFFVIYYEGFKIEIFYSVLGLLFILLSVLFLFKYLLKKKIVYFHLLTFTCILLILTKLNIGVAFTVAILLSLILLNLRNKDFLKQIVWPILLLGVVCVVVYAFLILNSPVDQLSKSFPYSSNMLMAVPISFIRSFFYADYNYIEAFTYFNNSEITKKLYVLFTLNIWYFFIIFAGFFIAYRIYKKEGIDNEPFKFIFGLAMADFFLTHEFLMLRNSYSLRTWNLSLTVILAFYLYNYIKNNSEMRKTVWKGVQSYAVFFLAGLLFKFYLFVIPINIPVYYCNQDRLRISVTNYNWYQTMNRVTDYIENNTSNNDYVLSMPFCIIYNFITSRKYPSRYTEFLKISGVTEKDEMKLINNIENKKVKLIIIEENLGHPLIKKVFGDIGKTHCFKISEYVRDNYEVVRHYSVVNTFGKPVIINIYKRETPFKQ